MTLNQGHRPLTFSSFVKVLFVFILALLAGCGHIQTQERIVYKTTYVVIEPEAQYFLPTPLPVPAEKKIYTGNERPDFKSLYEGLGIQVVELYKAAGMCNADKRAAQADIKKKAGMYHD